MTREEAERVLEERKKLRPELTWLIVGSEIAGWQVASVGMKPEAAEASHEEQVETQHEAPPAEDPRSVQDQLFPPWGVGA
jgi:hypothetical protein